MNDAHALGLLSLRSWKQRALSKQPDQPRRTERVSSQRIKERTESEFGFRNLIRQLTAMNERCSICILGSEIVGTNLFESVVACLLFEISRFCSLWFVPNWSLIEHQTDTWERSLGVENHAILGCFQISWKNASGSIWSTSVSTKRMGASSFLSQTCRNSCELEDGIVSISQLQSEMPCWATILAYHSIPKKGICGIQQNDF